MKFRPFSSHERGIFVSVDGPSGVGKSNVVRHLAHEIISERLTERGPHNRFQLMPGSSHAEVHFYRQATDCLIQAGFDVLCADCNQRPPEKSAAFIRDRLLTSRRWTVDVRVRGVRSPVREIAGGHVDLELTALTSTAFGNSRVGQAGRNLRVSIGE